MGLRERERMGLSEFESEMYVVVFLRNLEVIMSKFKCKIYESL